MNQTLVPAAMLRRFLIKREIARGQTCVLYSAEHRMTGRAVAIKLLAPEYADDEEAHKLLANEARALELARHPNVVDILDADTADGVPYLVLEMLKGRTLRGILTSRPVLPVSDAVAVGRQICDALDHAHDREMVHCSVQPSHVMLVRDRSGAEVVKLFDFKLALVPGLDKPGQRAAVTAIEQRLRSHEYAPLEMLLRGDIDQRSDVYSVGATMFECLAGAAPPGASRGEGGKDGGEQAAAMLRDLRLELPTPLADVIARAMSTQRASRHSDVRAFGLMMIEAAMEGFEPSRLLGTTPSIPPVNIAAEYTARFVPTFPPPPRPAKPAGEQRRKCPRHPYIAPIRLQIGVNEHIDGHSEDISEGGLLMVASKVFPSGGQGEVRIATPMTGKVARLPVVIRWVRDNRDRVAAGLEFVELPEATRAEIVQYVNLMDRRAHSSPPSSQ